VGLVSLGTMDLFGEANHFNSSSSLYVVCNLYRGLSTYCCFSAFFIFSTISSFFHSLLGEYEYLEGLLRTGYDSFYSKLYLLLSFLKSYLWLRCLLWLL